MFVPIENHGRPIPGLMMERRSVAGLCLAAISLLPAQPPGTLLALAAAPSVQAEAPLRVAFSERMFVDVNENDAGAALRVWAQMLGRDRGIPVDPAVRILQGTNEIVQAMHRGTVDVLTLPADEYYALRHTVRMASLVFGAKAGCITEEYVLLVHRDSGVRQVTDLRGHTLNLFQNPRACLAPAWVRSLLGKSDSAGLGQFFGRVTFCGKPARAMLPVFFRQADACVVTRQGFDTATELNPQVGEQLRILASSPAVVPVVFCFRDDYRSPFREKLLAELGNVHTTPAGRQFMNLFQCDTLVAGSETNLASALALLAACEFDPASLQPQSTPARPDPSPAADK